MSDTLNSASSLKKILRQLLGKRNYQILLILLALGVLLFGRGFDQGSDDASSVETTSSSEVKEVRVVHVVDGDTFEIEGGERVRLIGVDTPETVKPNAAIECFGKESSERLKNLIEGKIVRLERDRTDRDRYARLLRYAYLGDTLINEVLVREGYAESVAYKPDTAKQSLLDRSEEAARDERIGQWSPSACPE